MDILLSAHLRFLHVVRWRVPSVALPPFWQSEAEKPIRSLPSMDERIPVNAPTEENGSWPLIYCPRQEENPPMRSELTSCTQRPILVQYHPSFFNKVRLSQRPHISASLTPVSLCSSFSSAGIFSRWENRWIQPVGVTDGCLFPSGVYKVEGLDWVWGFLTKGQTYRNCTKWFVYI